MSISAAAFLPTVALLFPGEMGSAIARRLSGAGIRVITQLEGRSARTMSLAKAAAIEDVGDDIRLVDEADIVLSIVDPAAAREVVERFARAVRGKQKTPLFVDCNPITPEATAAAAAIVEAAGASYVDAGIIGNPPREGYSPRIYVSGPQIARLQTLAASALDIVVLSKRVGDASALKLCYATLTKGCAALMLQLLIAADRLGLKKQILDEIAYSQPSHYASMHKLVGSAVPKAFRWISEMNSIADMFTFLDMDPSAISEIGSFYQIVSETPLGKLKVEEIENGSMIFEELISMLSRDINFSSQIRRNKSLI